MERQREREIPLEITTAKDSAALLFRLSELQLACSKWWVLVTESAPMSLLLSVGQLCGMLVLPMDPEWVGTKDVEMASDLVTDLVLNWGHHLEVVMHLE